MVTMPRNDFCAKSTCEIFVIPPFFAAALIPMFAEPPKQRIRVVEASPQLLPTGLEVAAIGVVVEQLENIAIDITATAADINIFFILLKKCSQRSPVLAFVIN